jgi:VCBS repeat-containing protein
VIAGTTTGSVVEAGGVANAIVGTPTATGTLTDTDVDNPANTFTAVAAGHATTGGYGTYQMTAAGVWTYTLNNANAAVQALNVGQTLTDTFTVTTVDGTAQAITVTINGQNDAAVIAGTTTGSVVEAGGVANAIVGTPTATGTLTDTDVDNPANTFTAVATATATTGGHGTYTMTAGGVWTYTLNNSDPAVQALNVGQTLTDTFTVTTVDGTAQAITVTINGQNDAPTAAPVAQIGTENTPITLSWAAFGGADVDNILSSLSVKITSLPTDGTLTLNGVAVVANQVITEAAIAAGQLVFTPAQYASGFNGYATAGYGNLHHDYTNFNYQISDGSLNSSTANLVIDITPVATAPTLSVSSQITGYTAATIADTGQNITEANLSTMLGIPSTTLEAFNPPGINQNVVTTTNGGIANQNVSMVAGQNIAFNWTFINGEYNTNGVTATTNFNDLAVLVVTDPNGNKTTTLITSSEQDLNTQITSGTTTFNATTSGNYTFSLLALNGGDTLYDSQILSSGFTLAGNSYEAPVAIPITAGLVDTDGSEALSVSISGVPAGAIFSTGTNLGGGVWSFMPAQLTGLELYPASGFSGSISLTATATSTELVTGATATTTSAFTVNVIPSVATPVVGTDANDTINHSAVTTNEVILGLSGNDTITGGSGHDVIYGGAGNDTIIAGNGGNLIIGGQGNDAMTGGAGVDIFKWSLADAGTAGTPAVDTINSFGTAALGAGGDVLDIKDLLQGESHTAAVLDAYVHFQISGGNTTMYISATGAFGHGNLVGAPTAAETAATVQTIVFNGVNLVGAATSDLQVLQSLINNNKLITD